MVLNLPAIIFYCIKTFIWEILKISISKETKIVPKDLFDVRNIDHILILIGSVDQEIQYNYVGVGDVNIISNSQI